MCTSNKELCCISSTELYAEELFPLYMAKHLVIRSNKGKTHNT